MIANQSNYRDYKTEYKDYWRDIKKTNRQAHGGTLSRGKRKTVRPFNPGKSMHVVFRASRATGAHSLLHPRNRGNVNSIIYDHALRCDVKLYSYSNNGNHLHLLLRSRDHALLKKFLRSVAGIIARKVLRAERGCKGPKRVGTRRFWDALVFSRVSEWGRAFYNLRNYVIQNILEAAGAVPYRPRHYQAQQRYKPPPKFA